MQMTRRRIRCRSVHHSQHGGFRCGGNVLFCILALHLLVFLGSGSAYGRFSGIIDKHCIFISLRYSPRDMPLTDTLGTQRANEGRGTVFQKGFRDNLTLALETQKSAKPGEFGLLGQSGDHARSGGTAVVPIRIFLLSQTKRAGILPTASISCRGAAGICGASHRKRKPSAIALGFGGQTRLNCGVKLEELGILKKYGVRVFGTSVDAIRKPKTRTLQR